MKNIKRIVIIIISFVVLFFGFFFAKAYIVSKIAQKSIDFAVQQIPNLDFSTAKSFTIGENLIGVNEVTIAIELNKGILNIEPGEGTSITGVIKYLGQKPTTQFLRSDSGVQGQFNYKSVDEMGEEVTLYLPDEYAYSVNIGAGVAEVVVDLSKNNVPVTNIGVGAGKVSFAPPAFYSSTSNVGAGVGNLSVHVQKNTGRKVLFGPAFSNVSFGPDYTEIDGGYQTNNYQEASVKTDLSIGQALGGFSIEKYDAVPK